jgi:hypothetical protein
MQAGNKNKLIQTNSINFWNKKLHIFELINKKYTKNAFH